MTRVISFGSVLLNEIDGLADSAFNTNFANLVPKTTRLPGVSGGFDEYGDDAAPNEIGNVRWDFVIKRDRRADLDTPRNLLRAMVQLGAQTLVIEPEAGIGRRQCVARINNIDLSEKHTELIGGVQRGSINWQVSAPRWLSVDTPSGSGTAAACSGASTDFTRTNGGTAWAIPTITVTATTALPAGVVKVRRIVDSVVVDELSWDAALVSGDAIVIDCGGLTVTKNGAAAYSSAFGFMHPAWFRLLPGANTIRVVLGAGETADVKLDWRDTWV